MSDLAGFLAARLDEDEAWAKEGLLLYGPDAQYMKARVLREVEAKRKILGDQTSDHAPIESIYGTVCRTCVNWQDAPVTDGGETEFGIAIPQDWPCRVARSAVAAWSDHPDYDPAWAPALKDH